MICFVVLLPALKPACSSAMIFAACGFSLFSMIFRMTLLKWLIRLTVHLVLTLLQVAFLGNYNDKGLNTWGWPFSCLPDPVTACRESNDYCLPTCLDQFFWDVVNST